MINRTKLIIINGIPITAPIKVMVNINPIKKHTNAPINHETLIMNIALSKLINLSYNSTSFRPCVVI